MPPQMSVQIMEFCWLQIMSNLYLYFWLHNMHKKEKKKKKKKKEAAGKNV